MSNFETANALYQAHKKECKTPYDPYRTPRQCPECGRLIEEVAKAMIEDEKEEVKDE